MIKKLNSGCENNSAHTWRKEVFALNLRCVVEDLALLIANSK